MRLDAVRRAIDAELAEVRRRRPGEPPRVLDVGGGSGTLAVPLAAAGCAVTVVDPSPNALATLDRRAAGAGVPRRVTPGQGGGDRLPPPGPAGPGRLGLPAAGLAVGGGPPHTTGA